MADLTHKLKKAEYEQRKADIAALKSRPTPNNVTLLAERVLLLEKILGL